MTETARMGYQGDCGERSHKGSDLARRVYLHPATVVGILDRLEGRTLVMRMRSREDLRVVKLTRVPSGDKLPTVGDVR